MSVSYCEGIPLGPVPQGPQNNNPGPAVGGPRPRGLRVPPASSPAPELSELAERFQETIKGLFRSAEEILKNSLRKFSEPPAAGKPSEEIFEKLQELSDSPDLNLGLSLMCWSVGLDVDKCPAFLEESLKNYLQKDRPKH